MWYESGKNLKLWEKEVTLSDAKRFKQKMLVLRSFDVVLWKEKFSRFRDWRVTYSKLNPYQKHSSNTTTFFSFFKVLQFFFFSYGYKPRKIFSAYPWFSTKWWCKARVECLINFCYSHKLVYKVPRKFPEFVFCLYSTQVWPYNIRRWHDVQ